MKKILISISFLVLLILGALFPNVPIYAQENENNETENEYVVDNAFTIYPPSMIEGNPNTRSLVTLKTIKRPWGVYKKSTGSLVYLWSDMGIINYDGKVGFCVQPAVAISTSKNYSDEHFNTVLTAEKRSNIELIMMYGYCYDGHQTNDYYLATQKMIWEVGGDYSVKFYNSIKQNSSGNYYGSGSYSVADEESEIKRLIANHNVKPSFNNSILTLKVGDTTTITDTNGVINDYIIDKYPSNLEVTKDGNSLTIKALSTGNTDSIILRNGSEKIEGVYIQAHKASDAQTFVTYPEGAIDPLYANIQVNVLGYGDIELTKKDDTNNTMSTGFTFKIGTDLNGTEGTDWKYYSTDTYGKIRIDNILENTTIYYQEIEAPNKYVLDSSIHSIIVQANKTSFIDILNSRRGNLVLQKANQHNKILGAGFTFEFSYNSNMSSPFTVKTTDSNGQITLNNLLPQKVYYREVSVPSNDSYTYSLDNSIYSVTVPKGDTIKFTVNNNQSGKIQLLKLDSTTNSPIEGVKFLISKNSDMSNPLGTYVTDKDGIISENIPEGLYYYQEVETKKPYVLDDTIRNIQVDAGKTSSFTLFNQKQTGQIIITKYDKDTGDKSQGNATLFGAEYDILSGDKKTIVAHVVSDDTIATTNSSLPLGTYYIKETVAPLGMELNPNLIEVIIPYINSKKTISVVNVKFYDEVIKNRININKNVDESLYNKINSLQGFEFNIYRVSDNTLVDTIITDDFGNATSIDLPYGLYRIVEFKAEGYTVLDPFTVMIDNSTSNYIYKLENKVITSNLNIIKKDKETNNIIQLSNFGFKIIDQNGEYITQEKEDTFYTNDEGIVELPEPLKYGNYQIQEVSVNGNYLLNKDKISFTVDGTQSTIVKEFFNESSKGVVRVSKKGSILDSVKLYKTPYGNVHTPIYKETYIADVTFNIYANENIYASDNQSQLIYKKDDLVTSIITTNEGNNESVPLPLGKYYIKEIAAPLGYVIDTEPKEFTLSYKNDSTSIVYQDLEFYNELQKFDILFEKDFEFNENNAFQDTLFGLYTEQDIFNRKNEVIIPKDNLIQLVSLNSTNVPINLNNLQLPEGKYYLKELETHKEYILNDTKYPFELKYSTNQTIEVLVQDLGTIKNEHKRYGQIQVLKKGELITHLQEIDSPFGKVYTPVFEESVLNNVEFTIITTEEITLHDGKTYKANEVVETIVTNDDGVAISSLLPIGKYILKETQTLDHLILDKSEYIVEIKPLNDTFIDLHEFEFYNNRFTFDIQINKLFEDISITAFKDVVFGIYTNEEMHLNNDIVILKDALVDLIYLNEKGNNSTIIDLPQGKYYLKELQTGIAYQLDNNKYDFQLIFDDENTYTQVFNIENSIKRYTIEIIKTDSKNNDVLLNGALFEVIDLVTNQSLGYYSTGQLAIKGNLNEVYEIATDDAFTNIIYTLPVDELNEVILDIEEGIYYSRLVGTNDSHKHIVQEGTIIIENALYEHAYEIKEIKAPPSYKSNDEPLIIEVLSEDNTSNLVFNITNERIEVPNTGL